MLTDYKPIFFFIGFLVLLGCKDDDSPQCDILISNVNIVDVVSGEVIPFHNVAISGNAISLVEKVHEDKKYRARKIIDGSGKYIMPGLWDNHVHLRGGSALVAANKEFLIFFIVNGITGVRDAGGDLTNEILTWKEQIENGSLVGPRIFTSGPKIDGKNASWEGSLEVETPEEVKNALDSLEALHVDFVKIYDSKISRDLYLHTLEQAHERQFITSGHMPFTVLLEETVNHGIGSIEHLYYVLKGCSYQEKEITLEIQQGHAGFWDSFGKIMDTYDPVTARHTFSLLKEKNTYVVPTLHIGNVLSNIEVDNHEQDLYLRYVNTELVKTYDRRIQSLTSASPEMKEMRCRLQQRFKDLVTKLQTAGVPLMAGSDCGAFNSFVYPGESLHSELEAMVNAGLTPLEALRASTFNGASFLHKDDFYGTIDVGKSSDLILLDKNPLENISHTRTVSTVIMNGKIYNTKKLRNLLNTTLNL